MLRPGVERREDWAAVVRGCAGLRSSGDGLDQLDAWGLETTRELLVPSSPRGPVLTARRPSPRSAASLTVSVIHWPGTWVVKQPLACPERGGELAGLGLQGGEVPGCLTGSDVKSYQKYLAPG